MIIATKGKKKIDDLLQNLYIDTKEELDKSIFEAKVYTKIYIEYSFLEDEFILKNKDFNDYRKYISIIRPNVELTLEKEQNAIMDEISEISNRVKNDKELAMFILREPRLYESFKVVNRTMKEKDEQIYKDSSKLENLIEENKRLNSDNNRLRNENIKLMNNIKTIKSRLDSVRKLNYTFNLDKFNYVIYFKISEESRHMYSLITQFRNKLTTLSITSSVLTLLPHGAVIDSKKWQDRNFIDLREPKVVDLLSTSKAVSDLYNYETLKTFINNQKSEVLIIVDKTLGTFMPFESNNLILVSVGREPLQGIEGILNYGPILETDFSNMTITQIMDFYCNNECIDSIIRRLTNV